MKTDCSDNDGLRDSEGQDDHDGHKKSSSSSCRRFQDLARLNDKDMKQISALGVTNDEQLSFLEADDINNETSLKKVKKRIFDKQSTNPAVMSVFSPKALLYRKICH